MRITVYLDVTDVDEAARVAEILKPWKGKILLTTPSREHFLRRSIEERKEKILAALQERTTIYRLWLRMRCCRTYAYSYKVMQRDVASLIVEGRIVGEKCTGGATGTTTYIEICREVA